MVLGPIVVNPLSGSPPPLQRGGNADWSDWQGHVQLDNFTVPRPDLVNRGEQQQNAAMVTASQGGPGQWHGPTTHADAQNRRGAKRNADFGGEVPTWKTEVECVVCGYNYHGMSRQHCGRNRVQVEGWNRREEAGGKACKPQLIFWAIRKQRPWGPI